MAAHEPVCIGFKVCAKCGESKRALAFSVQKRSSDGLCHECRDCRRAGSHSYYARTAKASPLRDIARRQPPRPERNLP